MYAIACLSPYIVASVFQDCFRFAGARNESDCIDCTPGYYCAGPGNVDPSGLCDEGFFCAGRASTARPYDPGYLTTTNGTLS